MQVNRNPVVKHHQPCDPRISLRAALPPHAEQLPILVVPLSSVSPAIARYKPRLADDPMTRHQIRDRVSPYGRCDYSRYHRFA